MPIALHGNRARVKNLQPSTSNQQLPSLSRQASNLAAAATRAIGAAFKGRAVLVPVAVREHREAICAGCEENLSGRCRKCGCGSEGAVVKEDTSGNRNAAR